MGSSKSERQIPKVQSKFRQIIFTHLRDIPIPKLHPGYVTLIIETHFPKLLLDQEYKEGKHFEPYTIRTYFEWVLMVNVERFG